MGLGEELSFYASKNSGQFDPNKSIKEIKKDERLSLSHSTIMGNDSFRPSLGGGGFYDVGFDKDDFDFKQAMEGANKNLEEEEIGLLQEQRKPMERLRPQNFSLEQKMQWLTKMREQDEEAVFQNNFIENQKRFKQFDDNFYSQQRKIALS